MIIGLDMGKNIGIAFSMDSMAVPLCVARSFEAAAQKIIEKKAKALVVGLPLLLGGQEGEQCLKTRQMVASLLMHTGNMSVYFQDERFSSKFFAGKKEQDAHSAAWILQSFLDARLG